LVSYSGVLENLGKAFKLAYAKPLRCIAWPAKGYAWCYPAYPWEQQVLSRTSCYLNV
jgi:hypothetical protein